MCVEADVTERHRPYGRWRFRRVPRTLPVVADDFPLASTKSCRTKLQPPATRGGMHELVLPPHTRPDPGERARPASRSRRHRRLEREGRGLHRCPWPGPAAIGAPAGNGAPGHVRRRQRRRATLSAHLVEFVLPVPASKEAAAASAAGTVLAGIDPANAPEVEQDLAAYIARIPDNAEKQEGIKLGETVAARMLAARSNDGSTAPETYRPRTSPGVYVGTAPLLAPQWPGLKPFALKSADQFRPGPPVALTSREWATDYN